MTSKSARPPRPAGGGFLAGPAVVGSVGIPAGRAVAKCAAKGTRSSIRISARFIVINRRRAPQLAAAQEGATPPHWIWHREAAGDGGNAAETRYFRKAFAVKEPSRLVVEATADDSFTLYLDGQPVAEGADWHLTHRHETKLADRHTRAGGQGEQPGAEPCRAAGAGRHSAARTGRAHPQQRELEDFSDRPAGRRVDEGWL